MLNRLLIGVIGSAGAALIGVSGIASAQPPEPPPPPPLPNVNALAPVKLSDFAVMDNNWYAFKNPEGVTCVLQRAGQYGCSGPLPGAPEGANLVSGSVGGVPAFANAAADIFAALGEVQASSGWLADQLSDCQLRRRRWCDDMRRTPATSRASFVSPAGSFILNPTNPLLDRPDGANPFIN